MLIILLWSTAPSPFVQQMFLFVSGGGSVIAQFELVKHRFPN